MELIKELEESGNCKAVKLSETSYYIGETELDESKQNE